MLGGSLFGFGFVAFALAWRLTDPVQASLAVVLPCVVLFGSLGTFCLQSFGRLRDSIAVDSEGIWYLPRKGESTFIAWGEVASVSAQDTQQRLVLRDATGGRRIRLAARV
jgi:hypothetical protein